MLNWLIFWAVAVLFGVGHGLLIHTAIRLRRTQPVGDGPRSTPAADLGWTILTALASIALLVAVYFAMV